MSTPSKPRTRTALLAAALFAATAALVFAFPPGSAGTSGTASASIDAPVQPATKPKVEVVFVLDTTSSMSGLIDAAKANIWSIARTMASAQPAPDLKIGLVAFRDRGDDYVTRVVDLSGDLDSMYAQLMQFSAQGGGDGPEAVNEALHAAVHQVRWSQDPAAYQVIFLVGDAPPHMDYPDDVKYPDTLKVAAARGIVVNTILAGEDSGTQQAWQQIAGLSQGEFLKVSQGGDALAVATPFDREMAELAQDLDATRLYYGDAGTLAAAKAKTEASAKLAAEAPAAALAQRAAFNASASGRANFLGDNELVDDVASGKLDLAKVEADALPEPLRALPAAERERVVRASATRRAELSARIDQLAEQRQQFIETELGKDAAATARSLDTQLFGAVKEQAARKGMDVAKQAH